MSPKITIMACSTHAGPLRRITVPRWLLGLMACVLIAGVAGVAGLVYDHARLRSVVAEKQELTLRIARQRDRIDHQHKQIEVFADEINALQARLVSMGELESRIRMLAGLDADGGDGMLGIGGMMPSDLAAPEDPSQNHGRLMREMHERIETLDSAADTGTVRFEDLLDGIGEKHNMLACRPSIRPTTGYVTSSFGHRRSPFTGDAQRPGYCQPPGHARNGHRRRDGCRGRPEGASGKGHRDQSRLRDGNPLRTPRPVRQIGRRSGEAGRGGRLHGRHGPIHRPSPSLRSPLEWCPLEP